MRDRFQGALIGLALTPTVLSHSTFSHVQSDSSSLSALTRAIAIATTPLNKRSAHSGSSTTDSSTTDSSTTLFTEAGNDLSSSFWLPASVPILLRYHDSWTRRFRRLLPLSAIDNLTAPFDKRFSQILLLGDLLEAMDEDLTISNWSSWLTDCSARYVRWPHLHAQYQSILSALTLPLSALLTVEKTIDESHRGFIKGAASALTCPEGYALAVSSSAEPPAESESSVIWESVFVSGLLAGALQGRSAIPLLWQMQPSLIETTAAADHLFSLWTGIATAGELPD